MRDELTEEEIDRLYHDPWRYYDHERDTWVPVACLAVGVTLALVARWLGWWAAGSRAGAMDGMVGGKRHGRRDGWSGGRRATGQAPFLI